MKGETGNMFLLVQVERLFRIIEVLAGVQRAFLFKARDRP